MGTVRLSRELTQSYADPAEVQGFSFRLPPPPHVSLRPLLQGPSEEWPRPPDVTHHRPQVDPRGLTFRGLWTQPLGSGGRQGLRVRAASLASNASPQTPFSLLPSPLPREPATPGSFGTSPAPAPGAADPAEAPSPPEPGAHRPGARAPGGVLRVLFCSAPGPPSRGPSAPVLDFIH